MSLHYDSGYTANDRIDLMVSLLVRYPEMNTVKTDPKAGKIIFSFLLKKELNGEEYSQLEHLFQENIEAFLFIQNKQPITLQTSLQSYEGYSLLEVVRDFQTISQREIGLVIQLVHMHLGADLLTDVDEHLESEEMEIQEELIEDLLDRLQFDSSDETDMIGYREAGRVMVFQKANSLPE